jgi:toxin-antitoxin system PIN domain toxin
MIAVDTNVLVYAHRQEFPQHDAAVTALRDLAEGPAVWGLPVFVLAEFLRVTTHRQVLEPPGDERESVAALDRLLESPSVRVLSPGERYWDLLSAAVTGGGVRGNLVHDAAIAAVCREWGATEVLTEDREFSRFPGITVRRLDHRPAGA